MSFLALDGILGWPAKMYDASWVEWGNLSDEEGTLESNSPWRTDCGIPGATACTAIPTPATVTEAGDRTAATNNSPLVGDSFAVNANEINEEDKAACGGN